MLSTEDIRVSKRNQISTIMMFIFTQVAPMPKRIPVLYNQDTLGL